MYCLYRLPKGGQKISPVDSLTFDNTKYADVEHRPKKCEIKIITEKPRSKNGTEKKLCNEDIKLLNQVCETLNNARRSPQKIGIVEQRKGPQMYVYDPKIFEKALRNSRIRHARLNDTEDFLHYELYFPSGCRMVVAVPMNEPTKKNEEYFAKE